MQAAGVGAGAELVVDDFAGVSAGEIGGEKNGHRC